MKKIYFSSYCLLSHFSIIMCIGISGHNVELVQLSRTLTKLISSISASDFLDENGPADKEKLFVDSVITKIEERVKFQLYNELFPNGLYLRDPNDINSTNLLQDAPIKIITHGWLSGGSDEMCQTIKDRYLSSERVNVFIVHWDYIAVSYLYLFVVRKLKFIAAYYADFLERIIEMKCLNPEMIHLIGHSLGAHLSGQVGHRLASKNMKIGRITGLDPAFPGYQEAFGFHRLSKEDAKFVDVFHTCGGALGVMDPIGHVDFYPNGGANPMPGCEGFWSQKQCSHSRSWQYFNESISHPFHAVKCESFDSFRRAQCSNESLEIGRDIPKNARGSYFFSTNSVFPYTLGKNGTRYIPPDEDEDTTSRADNLMDEMISFQLSCDSKHLVEQ